VRRFVFWRKGQDRITCQRKYFPKLSKGAETEGQFDNKKGRGGKEGKKTRGNKTQKEQGKELTKTIPVPAGVEKNKRERKIFGETRATDGSRPKRRATSGKVGSTAIQKWRIVITLDSGRKRGKTFSGRDKGGERG